MASEDSRPVVVLSVNAAWNLVNFRAGLIRALLEAGYRVVALAPHDRHVAQVRALGCELIELPMDNQGTNPLRDLRLLWRYVVLLRLLRPRAFLGFTIKPNVYGSLACRWLGVPVINNVAGLGTAFMRAGWLNRLARLLYRVALRRSRRVFFQNQDDLALFTALGLVDAERAEVIPGSGVDLARFAPRPAGPRGPGTPLRALLVARLLWDKGVGEFVEAVELARASGARYEAQLLGFLDVKNPTAVPRARVEEWVERGAVTYLGERDDVRDAVAAADVVVLPSYREGTPRSLLEAAAMGKPLIATDVPGCREVVRDGENGLLVAARDSASLADALRRFADMSDDARQRMGAASRALVERSYDERLVIERYLAQLATLSAA